MATMNHYGNNHMLALEPRFMYDGAMAADAGAALAATDSADDGGATPPESIDYGDSDALLSLLQSEGYVPPAAGSATELLFLAHQEVDSPETFLGQLPDDMAVVGLDSDASNGTGLDAITDALAQHTGIEAIHIVSHGQSGAFSLGDMQLSADNLLPDGTQYDPQLATQLTSWSEHLTDDADILIYGCDVAKGGAGRGFIDGIAELTGADVAASEDATGAAGEGGDWELEWKIGEVETAVLDGGEDYRGTLNDPNASPAPDPDHIAVGDAGTAASGSAAEKSGAEIGGAIVPLKVNATLDTTAGDESYYDTGSITFEITNATANDQLMLNLTPAVDSNNTVDANSDGVTDNDADTGSLSTTDGQLSLLTVEDGSGNFVRTDVYMGDGAVANKIGTVDDANNGVNGAPLTIEFVPPESTELLLPNGGFETGDFTNWTVYDDNSGSGGLYPVSLDGAPVDYKFVDGLNDDGIGIGTVKVSTYASLPTSGYTIAVDSAEKSQGSYSLLLDSGATLEFATKTSTVRVDGNYSLHGPYVRSDVFSASAGDQIKVDWSAQGGQDAYEVFGGIITPGADNTFYTADDDYLVAFSQRGDIQDWKTSSVTLGETGDFVFEFLAGSYDEDGLRGLGATLYIDNLRRISNVFSIDEPEFDAIGSALNQALVYQNTYAGAYDCAAYSGGAYLTDDRVLVTTLDPGTDGTGNAITDTDTTIFINDSPDGGSPSRSIKPTDVLTISPVDFGFTDTDGHGLQKITIGTLSAGAGAPGPGTLSLTGEQSVTGGSSSTFDGGTLTFTPDASEPGDSGYTVTFTFRVEDNGGGDTALDPCPNTFTISVGAQPEPPEESKELPPPVEPPPAPPPVVPDNTTVMTLNVGESVPVRNDPAPKPVSQPMSLGALNAPMGDLGGTEAPGITLDSYQTDAGVTLKIPPSIGKSFEGVVKTQAKAVDSGLLPEGSVKFDPGSKFQKPSLEITNLAPDASGTTQVTVEGVNANGDTVQQTFEVTVENGVVTEVKPLQGKGNIDKMDGEATEEGGAGEGEGTTLKGKTTVEEGDGGDDAKGGKKGAEADANEDGAASDDVPAGELAPEGESGLPGGVIPQEGAFLWPPMEGLPLSGQLQQAAGGAFLARQASLLRAASAYHVHG
uniref:DUF4347 domain-containing protein n=1 Tax=Candidatus Kentrum sp. DK TaxID=2126562 RepID=A0A450SDS2_9GAMM|nr:MAG: protein of unknown function (DUF4347) [Candidatus Kentron sp. DK]